jgi:hypothetical protein
MYCAGCQDCDIFTVIYLNLLGLNVFLFDVKTYLTIMCPTKTVTKSWDISRALQNISAPIPLQSVSRIMEVLQAKA